MDLSSIAGMGSNLASSVLGNAGSNAGLSNAQGTYQGVMNAYGNILSQADAKNLQVALQQAQMNNYSPAMLQAQANVAPSAFQNVGPNQQILAQQMGNNAALQGVAQSGYTPEMMSAYNNMLNNTNANFQSQLAGIQQNQAARGMGSSGASLAMQANAAQSALNNAATASGNIAGQGFQNKLAAMSQLGGLTNAQQSQLSQLGLAQAQGLQQNAQYGTTLNADIAAQNVARQQQQANLETGGLNQFALTNTDIANRQAMQNAVNSKIQAANIGLAAAGGMGNAASGIAGAQIGQGKNSGAMAGSVAGTLGGLAQGAFGSDTFKNLFNSGAAGSAGAGTTTAGESLADIGSMV